MNEEAHPCQALHELVEDRPHASVAPSCSAIYPKVAWEVPALIQLAVESCDWNPVPEDGGLMDAGTWEQRTTQQVFFAFLTRVVA